MLPGPHASTTCNFGPSNLSEISLVGGIFLRMTVTIKLFHGDNNWVDNGNTETNKRDTFMMVVDLRKLKMKKLQLSQMTGVFEA